MTERRARATTGPRRRPRPAVDARSGSDRPELGRRRPHAGDRSGESQARRSAPARRGTGRGRDRPPGRGARSTWRRATATAAGDRSRRVVHPRVWQRRVAVLREQGHRRLRWVVGGVAVLVALCVALLVLHTPLLALRHATVRGADHTGRRGRARRRPALLDHPPLIDVDPKSVAARVEALPWVAHAVVVRHWPDSVTIIVTERVPLGSVAQARRRGGRGRRHGARPGLAGRRRTGAWCSWRR